MKTPGFLILPLLFKNHMSILHDFSFYSGSVTRWDDSGRLAVNPNQQGQTNYIVCMYVIQRFYEVSTC